MEQEFQEAEGNPPLHHELYFNCTRKVQLSVFTEILSHLQKSLRRPN